MDGFHKNINLLEKEMATRIIVGLIVLVALIQGLATVDSKGILPLALVVLGLIYAAVAVDAEDATGYLAVAIAVGAAAQADVLNGILVIGSHLDAIVDQISTALYAGVVTVLAKRIGTRLK